ncbi:MAG: hypothetical protein MJ101_03445 [Clostridia bacterium]|nr:hypothetical protein [Clostridia bacterium]
MSKTKSVTKTVMNIILPILLAIGLAGNIFVLVQSYGLVFSRILACVAILAILSAVYYCVKGYKKSSAPAYKAYMILSALFFQGLTVDIAIDLDSYYNVEKYVLIILIAANCLIFGLLLLLGFAKDLGKARTNFIGILSLFFSVGCIINMLIASPDIGNDNMILLYSRLISRISLVAVAYFMTQLKYIDKAERGAK